MVRQKPGQKLEKPKNTKEKPSITSRECLRDEKENSSSFARRAKQVLVAVIVAIAAYIAGKGYLETRVNTPFDDHKVVTESGLMVPDRYWGSYRPGNYFGLKTREPHSPVFGLMWYFPNRIGPEGISIRHWCEQGDRLERYTWIKHDGRNFGVQEIDDGPVRLTTSFVKQPGGEHGGDWTARVSVSLRKQGAKAEPIALLLYTALDTHTQGRLSQYPGSVLPGMVGETDKLGAFTIKLYNISGTIEYESHLAAQGKGLHLLKEVVMSTMRLVTVKGVKQILLPGDITRGVPANFTVTSVTTRVPFEMDVVFESGSNFNRPNTLTGQVYYDLLQKNIEEFDNKFESIFKLKQKGFQEEEIIFAQSALSNLVGGIGYFYGSSRVISDHLEHPVPYWKAPLYTSVPSRSFFPRGFLWDEGFHGLLIASWDLEIELDIMSHWFDLMNVEGWIPREQILGVESLAKVPEEFVTQINSNANPPTFFLTLNYIIKHYGDRLVSENRLGTLERMYTRLVKWFDWYNTTQTGELPGAYRWRGRDSKTNLELNPKTLASGLDDYPRASHPTVDERHVDLFCWITLGAKVLTEIALLLNRQGEKYANTFKYLSNNQLLDRMHWSYKRNTYADFGLHTDEVILEKPPPSPRQHGPPISQPYRRVVIKDPELQFVDSNFGYVSLFPLFLEILDPESPKLLTLLKDLKNSDYLWTNYGLRSLSKNSPIYMKRNTEHDPPYWRGPIWINMNYLALKSLNHYTQEKGPHSDLAKTLYDSLRQNLIKNMLKEYKRSGYVWEQYDDNTGLGQRSHPFTGWSSLIVLVMGEIY
ncbi:mannosyl-oligosaccharide glucosidase [Macrosteles quadrilineatus]|uniref:mannosyl-oligosaccharide glucosidase n=1 Tax=Macrosteles quadrilineatus TaxID=74068 RepID=UPI0023E2D494|nr:mannosyl-oligosaccharide glucosidase [Macrosteles quadrilineatus]